MSGEAGIGKTRLALQLAGIAEQEHLRVLWGRCWEGEESPAFWPWIQIFRTLALISGGHPGGPASPRPGTHGPQFSGDTAATGGAHKLRHLTPELSGLVALDAGALAHPSDQERFRLFDAATAFISQTAADRPLVLILDDIHASDRSSLLLLDFVAQHLQTIPVLVVGTFREPEGDTDALVADLLGRLVRRGHRIPLLGLRPEETAELLARGSASRRPPTC